jgi:hypothetical protein
MRTCEKCGHQNKILTNVDRVNTFRKKNPEKVKLSQRRSYLRKKLKEFENKNDEEKVEYYKNKIEEVNKKLDEINNISEKNTPLDN